MPTIKSPGYRLLKIIAEIGLDIATGGVGSKLVTLSELVYDSVRRCYDEQSGDELVSDWESTLHSPGMESTSLVAEVVAEVVARQPADVREEVNAYVKSVAEAARSGGTPSGMQDVIPVLSGAMPNLHNSYVVWLRQPSILGHGHYCHLSWNIDPHTGREGYKIRDYLGGILHYNGARASNEPRWSAQKPTNIPLVEVWRGSSRPIPAKIRSNKLFVPVTKFDWWRDTLNLKTQAVSNEQEYGTMQHPV